MSKASKIAELMVLHIPKEMGGDNTGSVIIAPHTSEGMDGWQLWTANRNDADAKKAEQQIRGYIEAAINAGCSAALTARDAAMERARVLANEVRAARALLVNDPVAGAIPEDCWTLATDIPRFADTNYSDARRATDAANALGGEQ